MIVLGDQLDATSAAFDGFDAQRDAVWMAEVDEESTHVWSHQARTTLFLSAMRHFRDELRAGGSRVEYRELGEAKSLGEALGEAMATLRPERVIAVRAGDYRVQQSLEKTADIEWREDRHFYCSTEEFQKHAAGRKRLLLEFFYRELRKKHRILMDGKQPVGGAWNFDQENRGSFGKQGPGLVPKPRRFTPDATTKQVMAAVQERFGDHPGSLEHFDFPVTRQQALEALDDFVTHRLPQFGEFQDALWTGEVYLYHSRLSAALNMKLLNPREVVTAAEEAYRAGLAPLAAAEGFIRQILGWREYVRGIYWLYMPEYGERNAMQAETPLPEFYWTGETEMRCLRETIGQTLNYGYAHHIQRLMVTGLYALLLGVRPREIHEWYLAVYVDAVEWAELPNVIGMSQFADGGTMATKPYVATGKYIQRMSNYCDGCKYQPEQKTGEQACPFTTLYWDYLLRHEQRLSSVPRMELQLRNLVRLSEPEKTAIRKQASSLKLMNAVRS